MESEKIRNVFDFDYEQYGEDIYNNLDKPKMSTIEYSESGEVIYEDYSKLDEYLDKVFIPEKVKYEINESYHERFNGKVRLKDIIILKLCFLEFCHVMDYLKEKNILVIGELPNLGERFGNYISKSNGSLAENGSFIDSFICQNKYLQLTPHETISKLIEYKKSNNPLLRKEIIEGNLGLVHKICCRLNKCFSFEGLYINELESYGYEGLIKCVDKFDPFNGKRFSSLAYNYIMYFIIDGVYAAKYNNYKKSKWASDFILCKKEVENTTGLKLEDNHELAYLINDLMYKKGYVGIMTKRYDNLNRILLTVQISLEESDKDDVRESSFDVEKEVQEREARRMLIESLKKLNDRQRKVIEYRYGFYDGRKHTLEETGRVLNVTAVRVGQIESKTIRILRKLSIDSKLKEFY